MERSASGMLIPLLFDKIPPSVTSVRMVSPLTEVTRSPKRPSSKRSASPPFDVVVEVCIGDANALLVAGAVVATSKIKRLPYFEFNLSVFKGGGADFGTLQVLQDPYRTPQPLAFRADEVNILFVNIFRAVREVEAKDVDPRLHQGDDHLR